MSVLFLAALAACDDVTVTDRADLAPVANDDDDAGIGVDDDDGVTPAPACPDLPPADDPLEVQTTRSTLRGFVHDEGGFAWTGVRFAAPPTGERRFAKPAPPACASDVVDASRDPPQCLQPGPSLDAVVGDEDCLFLNVYRPQRRDDDPAQLPVMFWIHGGGQLLGSGHQPTGFGNLYDAARLADTARAVVVSVNYRLGPLGFLAHPSLADRDGVVGNWAHHDLLAALRWTRDNVAGFGGDPTNVTIFGESAGAHNVCVLLASPLSAGLFHRAILQSGGCDAAPMDVRLDEGEDTAAAVGCASDDSADAARCLRDVSGEQLIRTPPPIPPLLRVWQLPWGSVVDGEVLPDQPMAIIGRGEHHDVPVIVGSNKDEAALFIGADVPLTCIDLRLRWQVLLDSSFADGDERDAFIDELLDTYRCSERLSSRAVSLEAATDLEFTCHARRLARALSTSQTAPVYRYHFRDQANLGVYAGMGAFHAWELAYVFDGFTELAYLPSPAEQDLARLMQQAWGSFARDGVPDVDGMPAWASADDDRVFAFDEDPFAALGGEVEVGMAGDPAPACDLWDRYAID